LLEYQDRPKKKRFIFDFVCSFLQKINILFEDEDKYRKMYSRKTVSSLCFRVENIDFLDLFFFSSLFFPTTTTTTDRLQKDEVYLNLVLEYIPETVYKVARQYAKNKLTIPNNFIRVSMINMNYRNGGFF
jgi:hypothetical protein